MTTTRYMVSSDYFNRHDEWWLAVDVYKLSGYNEIKKK